MNTTRIAALLLCAAGTTIPVALQAQTNPSPAATSTPAGGGPKHHHHGRHGHHGGYMRALQTLTLTPAQQQQIDTLAAATKKADAGATPDVRKANRAKFEAQVQALLTPAQQQQLQAALTHGRRHATPQP